MSAWLAAASAGPISIVFLCCGTPASPAPSSAPDSGEVAAVDAGGCPSYEDPAPAGFVADPELIEASGLVESRKNPGVYWALNDSGDSPRLFALGEDGRQIGRVALGGGARAVDWEDLAIGPGPGGADALWAGDIGDNDAVRASITVYRVEEPAVAALPAVIADVAAIELTYGDGRAHNAEAMIVDPVSGALVVVTKEPSGKSTIFVADPPLAEGTPSSPGRATLRAAGVLAFDEEPLPNGKLVTGASITRDGALVALRTYTSAFAWNRAPGTSIETALLGIPCPLPLATELQGEAIALSPDGSRVTTTSEGRSRALNVARRR